MFASDACAVSERLIEELASRQGTTPAELHPPLYETVDLEVLDAFLASGGERSGDVDRRVEFEYEGYWVRVEGDGSIAVDEPEES